ncbi:helix-turn-helix domain-containing protein [Paenibacillus sp. JSM ZJ436]|uniref:AraC family transcriptional regulator n=1 Tax=Paenibacillus algicola TaxID=2565926 RepID=A0A4P8XGB2_9BACL|nr:helix-turn-helix domain-containing protein [Paenibacillus algicola]QCT01476.1 AraC family transcriptional regulator [Paenibacillus algicola]
MRWNLYTKYLLAFIVMFSIPVAILGIFIYTGAVSALRTEIEETNLNRLHLALDSMDQQFLDLTETTVLMSLNPDLSSFHLLDDTYASTEIIKEIQKYKASSSYFEEIFYHRYDSGYFYSSNAMFSLSSLIKDYYMNKTDTAEHWINSLKGNKRPFVRPTEPVLTNQTSKEIITIGIPFPVRSLNPYGIVLYLFDSQRLYKLMAPVLGDFRGAVYVFDQDQNLLTSKANDLALTDEFIKKLLVQASNSEQSSMIMESNSMSVTWVKSEATGWTYMTLLPTSQFYQQVLKLTNLIVYILISLIFIGITVAIVLSKRFYKPIQQLISKIQLELEAAHPLVDTEINYIAHSFENMTQNQQSLLYQMENQKKLIQDQFLIKLIHGYFSTELDVCAFMKEHQVVLCGNSYFVFSFSTEEADTSLTQDISNSLSEFSSNNISVYPIEFYRRGTFACIVGLSNNALQHSGTVESIVKEIQEIITSKIGTAPTISIGRVYGMFLGIHRSYIESLTAKEYQLKFSTGSIINYIDVVNWNEEESTSWYSTDIRLTLLQSIKQGDEQLALESLKQILQEINTKKSLLMTKCMTSDLVNSIFKLVHTQDFPHHLETFKQLINQQSMSQFEKDITQCVIDLCSHIKKRKNDELSELSHRILSYIHDRYLLYEFNLGQMAEELSLSPSFISRSIKDLTGSTFTDYVFDLRIEHVKNELMHTDKSIKDIITGAGYINVSYFIDRFKKKEGVTPGEFRKMGKQMSNDNGRSSFKF